MDRRTKTDLQSCKQHRPLFNSWGILVLGNLMENLTVLDLLLLPDFTPLPDPAAVMTMKSLTTFLAALLLATWVSAIAVLSVQNFTAVRLRFLTLQFVEVPVGIVLAFGVGVGMVGTAVVKPLLQDAGFQDRDDIGDEE